MSDPHMTDPEKERFFREVPDRDSNEPAIRYLASSLFDAAKLACPGHDATRVALAFCHLAHAVSRDVVAFVTDTARVGHEDFPGKLSEVLERGKDDCDAKARVFVALCRAAGLYAEIVPHWRDDPSGATLYHVSAVCVLPDGETLAVETTLRRARLGEKAITVPKESDGKWLR